MLITDSQGTGAGAILNMKKISSLPKAGRKILKLALTTGLIQQIPE